MGEAESEPGHLPIDTGSQWHTAVEVGLEVMHGLHAQGMRRPLEHFPERVAGNGVVGVGGDFWAVTGRIGPWA